MDGSSRYRGYIVLILVLVVVLGVYTLWSRRPRPEPLLILDATPAPTEVVPGSAPLPAPTNTAVRIRVHVAGAVRRPGVYALSADSRVVDAVRMAGGLAPEADPLRVNLADFLRDGQQVIVPFQETPLPPSPTAMARSEGSGTPGAVPRASGGLININTASAAELESLPGIGPVYAQRIIAYRQEHGLFVDTSEIMQVKGIGPACFDDIQDRITTE